MGEHEGRRLWRVQAPFEPNTTEDLIQNILSAKGESKVANNTYHVTAQFERAKFDRKVETWTGARRNMRLAIRAAASVIMARRNVKRYRHERVTFFIEKMPNTK
jgi:hypothetical protein